jgi:hypothetical protein
LIDVDSHAAPAIVTGSTTVVSARSKRLLSISGGGIRGIIPCLALVELERQMGCLAREIFDWVGGTSTGALLTATVAAGIPASESLKVYVQHGPEIFSPHNPLRRKLCLVEYGRMFDNAALYRAVAQTLGDKAGMKINDSPINIMIVAGDMLGVPCYFVKDRPGNASTTGTAPLVDAAVASACATTYHDAWRVPGGFGHFADGGCVSLADPVYELCAEGFRGYQCYGDIDPADARVISLGTGFYKPDKMPLPPDDLLENIKWVTGSLVGSSKTLAVQAVMRHWPGVLSVYNPSIPDIDEADVNVIPALLEIGRKQADQMDWKAMLS